MACGWRADGGGAGSYQYNYMRVGVVILFLHDVSDITAPPHVPTARTCCRPPLPATSACVAGVLQILSDASPRIDPDPDPKISSSSVPRPSISPSASDASVSDVFFSPSESLPDPESPPPRAPQKLEAQARETPAQMIS